MNATVVYQFSIFIKIFHFVVKHFSVITASRTLLCCPIVGNYSDIRKVAMTFSRNTKTVLKLQQMRDMFYGREEIT